MRERACRRAGLILVAAAAGALTFLPAMGADAQVATIKSADYMYKPLRSWNGKKVYLAAARHADSGGRGECRNPGWEENVNSRVWGWFIANSNHYADKYDDSSGGRNLRSTARSPDDVEGLVDDAATAAGSRRAVDAFDECNRAWDEAQARVRSVLNARFVAENTVPLTSAFVQYRDVEDRIAGDEAFTAYVARAAGWALRNLESDDAVREELDEVRPRISFGTLAAGGSSTNAARYVSADWTSAQQSLGTGFELAVLFVGAEGAPFGSHSADPDEVTVSGAGLTWDQRDSQVWRGQNRYLGVWAAPWDSVDGSCCEVEIDFSRLGSVGRVVWQLVLIDGADPRMVDEYWPALSGGYANRPNSNDGGFDWGNFEPDYAALAGFLVSSSGVGEVTRGEAWDHCPDLGETQCGVVKAGDEDLKLWVLGDVAPSVDHAEIKSASQGTSDWTAAGVQFPQSGWDPATQAPATGSLLNLPRL